jgi:hypothetical protein
MNASTLLDYQLGQLGPSERARVESSLAADPELAARSRRLGESLRLLLDDGDGPEPPADLAARALAHVARNRTIPMRPDWAPTRARFRPADLAVAATIFLAAAATLLPAVARVRNQATVVKCANNLRELGTVLGSYASTTGHFPYHKKEEPLCESIAELVSQPGSARSPSVLSCPSNEGGFLLASVRPEPKIQALLERVPAETRPAMNHGYAFNVGHRDPAGAPIPVEPKPAGVLPLAADPPRLEGDCRIADGNSPSHSGGGQNVLFTDLHVRWLPERRWARDPDIYKNDQRECSYGLSPEDAALIPLLMPMD